MTIRIVTDSPVVGPCMPLPVTRENIENATERVVLVSVRQGADGYAEEVPGTYRASVASFDDVGVILHWTVEANRASAAYNPPLTWKRVTGIIRSIGAYYVTERDWEAYLVSIRARR